MLDEDRVGLVIADVSDKGMPAALYMTVARTLIHSEALEGDLPSAALMRVNRSLLLNSQKGLFVTCLYAILNTKSGEMTYATPGITAPYGCANRGGCDLAGNGRHAAGGQRTAGAEQTSICR